MTSRQGLNAYGAKPGSSSSSTRASTTASAGSTPPSASTPSKSSAKPSKKTAGYVYKHGSATRPVSTETITLDYKTPNGPARKTFTTYDTHHGPIDCAIDG
jgi:acyl-homoserine-lactone acylase